MLIPNSKLIIYKFAQGLIHLISNKMSKFKAQMNIKRLNVETTSFVIWTLGLIWNLDFDV